MSFRKKCLLIAVSVLTVSGSAIAQEASSRIRNAPAYLKILTVPSSNGETRTTFEMCQVSSRVTGDTVDCAAIGNPDGYTRSEIETAERRLQWQVNRSIGIRVTGTIIGMVAGGAIANATMRSVPQYSGSLNIIQELAQSLVIGVGGGIGGAVGLGVGVLVADSLGNLEIQSASRDALASSRAEGGALVIVDQADGKLNEVVHVITTVLMSIEAREN
jgi:hypothetical protein